MRPISANLPYLALIQLCTIAASVTTQVIQMQLQMTTPNSENLLRMGSVTVRVGMSRSAVYQAVRQGAFPPPIKLSRKFAAWPSSAIDAWIAKQIPAGYGVTQNGK